jgi:transcriptional regulator with XRE-family HTH domain
MSIHKGEKVRIAQRLKAARERAHLEVEDAAAAVGVLPLAIAKWERGVTLPSLLEFRQLLPVYGVMACEVLFDRNPWALSQEQAAELARAAKGFTPELRVKVDTLLAMIAQAKEPAWKNG